MLLGACGLTLVAAGCAPTGAGDSAAPSEPVPLLDPIELDPVDADDDPLAHHRPDPDDPLAGCPRAAWGEESGSFEVQTGVCAYGAFAQPLPVALGRGDVVEIVVWHDTLDAAEPATGHVAVWLGDDVVWEDTVSIPAASATLTGEVTLSAAVPAGAPLGLHLHNHGYISWRLVSVERR